MSRVLALTGVCLAALLPAPASAQTAAPGDQAPAAPAQRARTTVYDAAFFAQYAPRTALDIAQHVPGFSVDLGNTEIRGFGGAAGNVVINGQRPSSKSDTIQTILQRIPAGRWGRPADLAGATVFLASAASDYVHGTVIPVDGGWLGR